MVEVWSAGGVYIPRVFFWKGMKIKEIFLQE
jgi:hypothetical protein